MKADPRRQHNVSSSWVLALHLENLDWISRSCLQPHLWSMRAFEEWPSKCKNSLSAAYPLNKDIKGWAFGTGITAPRGLPPPVTAYVCVPVPFLVQVPSNVNPEVGNGLNSGVPAIHMKPQTEFYKNKRYSDSQFSILHINLVLGLIILIPKRVCMSFRD